MNTTDLRVLLGKDFPSNRDVFTGWDQFITDAILQSLDLYQKCRIAVPVNDRGEIILVPVHIPYMLQTVSIIEDTAAFARLPRRHQNRLIKVKTNRENALKSVQEFLQGQLYTNSREQFVAQSRADVEAIHKLLQAAANQGHIPVTHEKPYPNSYELRMWL